MTAPEFVARRLDGRGAILWESPPVAFINRAAFVSWVRACCDSAGFAARSRRQTDLPAIWQQVAHGQAAGFTVRNYSPLGQIRALAFETVN